MPETASTTPAALARGQRADAEQPDAELLALPAPPRGQRFLAMGLMAAVVAAALGLLASLGADVAYRFAADRALDLGSATSLDLSALETNAYVRVRGVPMLSSSVRFERGFSGREYAVFALAGQHQVFVQVPVEALSDPTRVAQGEWNGRLMSFGELGARYRSVRQYLGERMGLPVTAESFVVLAEEAPRTYDWALGLSALCLSIVALMVWLLLRWFRPLPLPLPMPLPMDDAPSA